MFRSSPLAAALCLTIGCAAPVSTKLATGEVCNGSNAACASNLCLKVDTDTSLCTSICKTDSQCPTGYLCTDSGTVGQVCLPVGLNGACKSNQDCSAGFICDTTADRCYIPVSRTLCSPCTSSLQCPHGGFCRNDASAQTCTTPCSGAADCPSGYTCTAVTGATGTQCVPDNAANTCSPDMGLCASCNDDFECGGGGNACVQNLASHEQFCGTSCKTSSDCPSNFNCSDLSGIGNGPNVCVPNSGTCMGYCDSTAAADVLRECGLAATCNLMTRTCTPKTDGSLCAACNTDDDCAATGGSCLVNNCTNCPFKGQKFCSNQCQVSSGASACPLGFTCGQLGTGTGAPAFCLPNSGSCRAGQGAIGDDCTALGPAACASGICLGLGTESVCSVSCTATADCGRADFQCCALSADGSTFNCTATVGSAGGVCAPIGGAPGADCSPGQPPCYNGVCLDLGTASVCTLTCTDDASCTSVLPGFSCKTGEQQNGDGTQTSVKVCFPNGGGGTGANCDFGPAACQSGLCLTKETGNVCTQACSSSAPCPSGYSCRMEVLAATPTMTSSVCVPLND